MCAVTKAGWKVVYWTIIIAVVGLVWPWGDAAPVIVDALMLGIALGGTFFVLRLEGRAAAWIYAVASSSGIVGLTSRLIEADRLAATSLGALVVDSIWIGLVLGTIFWGVAIGTETLRRWAMSR